MEILPSMPILPVSESDVPRATVQEGVKSFKDLLDKALQGVDELQKNAQQLAAQVATGDASSFHEAVIASSRAALALDLAVQVQTKVIDAYSEISRMSI
jgi:flagellar hook-basal body complex protein FliE